MLAPSMRIVSMRAWAMLVATTRRELVEVVFRPLTNSGTMARKMIPARKMVISSSIKLKPRSPRRTCAVALIGSTSQA